MSIQIVGCPSCNSFLLEDACECPVCGHVFDVNRAAITQSRPLPTDLMVNSDMDACPNCGENCRTGLVRCWNCSVFLKPEIAASYQRIREQASPETIEVFDLEIIEASTVTHDDLIRRRSRATPESFIATVPVAIEEYVDFELADDVQLTAFDDDDFELSDGIFLPMEDVRQDLPVGAEMLQIEHGFVDDIASDAGLVVVETLSDGLATASPANQLETAMALNSEETASSQPELVIQDQLMTNAVIEEAEIARIRKTAASKNTFVIFCPQGHRIRVKEKSRGQTGKCPKCESVFVVPLIQKPDPQKQTDFEMSGNNQGSSRYSQWLTDIHLHTVVPEKLKLKADSLLNEFQPVDIGFSAIDVLMATLLPPLGLFGGAQKKRPLARASMLEHLSPKEALIEGLSVAAKRTFGIQTFAQLSVVQPMPPEVETMFGGIPIFGVGRIAFRVPKLPEDKYTQYLSFSLSEFRAFLNAMQTVCGINSIGENTEIPIVDQYETYKCHVSQVSIRNLRHVDYYRRDPSFKLEVKGWKCSACGIAISEEGRIKVKLGGLKGKSLAKTKCPKCTKKFGNQALVVVEEESLHLAEAAPSTGTL